MPRLPRVSRKAEEASPFRATMRNEASSLKIKEKGGKPPLFLFLKPIANSAYGFNISPCIHQFGPESLDVSIDRS